MGDESQQRGSEQAAPDGFATWNAYWTAQGMPWRTEPEIDEKQQRCLADRCAVKPDIEKGIYPFRDEYGGITLTRADVEWLLATHESGHMVGPVDWNDPKQQLREGLDLRGAQLQNLDLRNLPLAKLCGGIAQDKWYGTTEQQRAWAAINLEGTDLRHAKLQAASLRRAQMANAQLPGARLEMADLHRARMQRVFLAGSELAGADLQWAHMEGAWLSEVNFGDTDMRGVLFDITSDPDGSVLGDDVHGFALVTDLRWNGINLAAMKWSGVKILGDERLARQRRARDGTKKPSPTRLAEYEAAVRANRQLAVALRAQGLTELADRFAYRAQVLQQQVFRRQGITKWPACLGSLLLWALSGYGYRIWRIFGVYVLMVGLFTAAFLAPIAASSQALPTVQQAVDALQISLNAIHGRVFFAQFHLDTLQSWLATAESIIGIIIEGVFVAMLVQRFFGGR